MNWPTSKYKKDYLVRLAEFERSQGYDPRQREKFFFDFYINRLFPKATTSAIINREVASYGSFQSFLNLRGLSRPSELDGLNRDGITLLDEPISSSALNSIYDVIGRLGFTNRITGETRTGLELINGLRPGYSSPLSASGNFWLRQEDSDSFHASIGFDLILNPTFLALASAYLNTVPVHVSTSLWFSFPDPSGTGHSISKNAQAFHQDSEFLDFLKIFIYLTDVDASKGPHVYVKGSHRAPLYKYGVNLSRRVSDDFIMNTYGADKLEVVTGKAGTAFAADTFGAHKGLPPTKGVRLVMQLEYANSLYITANQPFRDPPNNILSSYNNPALDRILMFHKSEYLRRYLSNPFQPVSGNSLIQRARNSVAFRIKSKLYHRQGPVG
jgi:hypothetical protein